MDHWSLLLSWEFLVKAEGFALDSGGVLVMSQIYHAREESVKECHKDKSCKIIMFS